MKYPDDVAFACSKACRWPSDRSVGLRMTGASCGLKEVEGSAPVVRTVERFVPTLAAVLL